MRIVAFYVILVRELPELRQGSGAFSGDYSISQLIAQCSEITGFDSFHDVFGRSHE